MAVYLLYDYFFFFNKILSDSDEDGSFEGVEIGSGDDSEFDFDDEDDLTDNEMDIFPSNVPNGGGISYYFCTL